MVSNLSNLLVKGKRLSNRSNLIIRKLLNKKQQEIKQDKDEPKPKKRKKKKK